MILLLELRPSNARVVRIVGDSLVAFVVASGIVMPVAAQERPRVLVRPDAKLNQEPPTGGRSFLQLILERVDGPTVLTLTAGRYVLEPTSFTDSTCGNCEDPNTPVLATYGLRLSGQGIELVGVSPDSVIIHTNAGYGIFFDGCSGCALRGVTVTGGTRDADGRATDAAIVVKHSSVTIDRCSLLDNIGDSATVAETVVGIAGIVGREESEIDITNCRIVRNSWDGIALYRGARAVIRHNTIDGVDLARGGQVGGGRGVGIGMTWDARATVEGNLVRRYWKGIGVFVDARATIRYNIVEDMLTWGIALWGAEAGSAAARLEENVVYRTGACGAMIDRRTNGGADPPGYFRNNLIVETGQDARYDSGEPYCHQRPLARHIVPQDFHIADNVFFNNRQPGTAWAIEDEVSPAEFRSAVERLLPKLDAIAALAGSSFLRDFR